MDSDFDLGATIRGLAANDRVFDRYVLQRILGRGAMGVVWLATDETLDRPVALKFLPHMICLDEAMLEELKEEARRSLELTHQSIVRIYDIAHDTQYAAISMEYIEGKPLSAIRAGKESGFMEAAELEPILEQLIAALSYAHQSAKVVHRDLKPANVLMTDSGVVKLADFGISRSISDTVSRISIQRSSSGTLAYMSPQQALGKVPSVEDDIYSLAAMVYDLLTSKPPFHSGDVITQIERVSPPSMAERRRELGLAGETIPANWETAVARALSKETEDRYPTVEDFWRDIRGEEIPERSRPRSKGSVAAALASSAQDQARAQTTVRTTTPATAARGKSPVALVTGIVVAVLVISGVGYGLHARQQLTKMKSDLSATVEAAKAADDPTDQVQLLQSFLTKSEQSSLPAFLTSSTLQEARDELAVFQEQAQKNQQEQRQELAQRHQEILAERDRLMGVKPRTVEEFSRLESDIEALRKIITAFDNPDYTDGLVTVQQGLDDKSEAARQGADKLRTHLAQQQQLDRDMSRFEELAAAESATMLEERRQELQQLAGKMKAFAAAGDESSQDSKNLLDRLAKQQQAIEEQQTTLAEAKAKAEAEALVAAEKKAAEEAAKTERKGDMKIAADETKAKPGEAAALVDNGDAKAKPDTVAETDNPGDKAPAAPSLASTNGADSGSDVMPSSSPPPAGSPESAPAAKREETGAIDFSKAPSAAKAPPQKLSGTKELFEQSRYSDYGTYGKRKILERVQTQLKKEGLYSSGIDGAYGPGTHRAIVGYQEKAGLPTTGRLSDEFLVRMSLQNEPDRRAPAPPPKPVRTSKPQPKPSTQRVTTAPPPKPAPPSNGIQSGLAPPSGGDIRLK